MKGFSGDEKVIDIGSPSYLLPLVNLDKVYDVRDLKQVTESDPLFVVGAGAGPWPHVGSNCEVSIQISFTMHNSKFNIRFKLINHNHKTQMF